MRICCAHCFGPPSAAADLSHGQKFTAGLVAGAAATSATYPLEALRWEGVGILGPRWEGVGLLGPVA